MLSIQRIKHDDIDIKKWNKTILKSEIPTVYAHSYFLDAMCYTWEALVINDYETVFPLTWKKKFGIKYLPQPYFTSQLGVFGVIDDEREKLFYQYILKHFKLIEYELNSANHIQSKYIQPKHTFVIEYKNGFSFNQNTKRNIAKAKASGMRVLEVPELEITWLSEQILNPFLLQELNIPELEVSHFGDLVANCLYSNALYTLTTVNEKNEIKAIAHFVFNSRYALFLKGTNTDKADNSGSMHLLMEHAINFFAEKKVECFDFGGGSVNEGLANFYKGFGGTQRNFSFLRVNNLPKALKLLKR